MKLHITIINTTDTITNDSLYNNCYPSFSLPEGEKKESYSLSINCDGSDKDNDQWLVYLYVHIYICIAFVVSTVSREIKHKKEEEKQCSHLDVKKAQTCDKVFKYDNMSMNGNTRF